MSPSSDRALDAHVPPKPHGEALAPRGRAAGGEAFGVIGPGGRGPCDTTHHGVHACPRGRPERACCCSCHRAWWGTTRGPSASQAAGLRAPPSGTAASGTGRNQACCVSSPSVVPWGSARRPGPTLSGKRSQASSEGKELGPDLPTAPSPQGCSLRHCSCGPPGRSKLGSSYAPALPRWARSAHSAPLALERIEKTRGKRCGAGQASAAGHGRHFTASP